MLRPNKELRQAVLLAFVALTASIIPTLVRTIKDQNQYCNVAPVAVWSLQYVGFQNLQLDHG